MPDPIFSDPRLAAVYDAVMALCGVRPFPGASNEPAPGTTSSPESSAEPAPAMPAPVKLPGGTNTKVIVRIDHTALIRGSTIAGETCEVAGLGPVSVSTVKDLMADAFLAAVITKGCDVVNVAHLGRGPNAHQRTALDATGSDCTNIACNRTVNIQIDHRIPYAANPETKLGNLDRLCSPDCHDLKTHHGWELEAGTGRRRLLPPDHPDHPDNRRPTEADPGPPPHVEQPTLC